MRPQPVPRPKQGRSLSPRILIIIGGHLSTAPRAQKEAEALSQQGYRVHVVGTWFDRSKAEIDRELAVGREWSFAPIVDLTVSGLKGAGSALLIRLKGRAARIAFRVGMVSPRLLGPDPGKVLRFARRFNADLTIVHSESGLWIADALLREKKRVGVDFEDWFSEDLLPIARRNRPVKLLRRLERRVARESVYSVTTSSAMSEALAEAYECRPPVPVYNSFPDRPDAPGVVTEKRQGTLRSLHWFSQTIGPGRGLETLFQALALVSVRCEVHIRGQCTAETKAWIFSQVRPDRRDWLTLHPPVHPEQLSEKIAEHDVGLALETSEVRSRDLTVTNKIIQYMEGGLAIIATATKGQKEVFAAAPECGILIPELDPAALASAIEILLTDERRLESAKKASKAAATQSLAWDWQKKKIQAAARQALSNGA